MEGAPPTAALKVSISNILESSGKGHPQGRFIISFLSLMLAEREQVSRAVLLNLSLCPYLSLTHLAGQYYYVLSFLVLNSQLLEAGMVSH